MLWDPSHIPEVETEEFLERAQLPTVKGTSLPSGSHIRDDEQALYLLLQCGYNLDEALRRRRMNVQPQSEAVSLWSEEECHNFESGLRNYGKDFHLIQKNKVHSFIPLIENFQLLPNFSIQNLLQQSLLPEDIKN